MVIYDLQGRRINTLIDNNCQAGLNTVIWNGTNESGSKVDPGIYICVLRTNEGVSTRKLFLIGE
jgi:flagellar hook assembly protein FlgD